MLGVDAIASERIKTLERGLVAKAREPSGAIVIPARAGPRAGQLRLTMEVVTETWTSTGVTPISSCASCDPARSISCSAG